MPLRSVLAWIHTAEYFLTSTGCASLCSSASISLTSNPSIHCTLSNAAALHRSHVQTSKAPTGPGSISLFINLTKTLKSHSTSTWCISPAPRLACAGLKNCAALLCAPSSIRRTYSLSIWGTLNAHTRCPHMPVLHVLVCIFLTSYCCACS